MTPPGAPRPVSACASALRASTYPICPSGSLSFSSSPRSVRVRSSGGSELGFTPVALVSSRNVSPGRAATVRSTAWRLAPRGARGRGGRDTPASKPAGPAPTSSKLVGGSPAFRHTKRRSDHTPPEWTGSHPAAAIDANSAPMADSSSRADGFGTPRGQCRPLPSPACGSAASLGAITAWKRSCPGW